MHRYGKITISVSSSSYTNVIFIQAIAQLHNPLLNYYFSLKISDDTPFHILKPGNSHGISIFCILIILHNIEITWGVCDCGYNARGDLPITQ